MKALSVRQPWAWLILHGGKDFENRNRPTRFRGRFWVHASKGMTRAEYAEARDYAATLGVTVPPADQLQRGGIIGSVELVNCLIESDSPWFFGTFGFLLRAPRSCRFSPWPGQLGFFDVPPAGQEP